MKGVKFVVQLIALAALGILLYAVVDAACVAMNGPAMCGRLME